MEGKGAPPATEAAMEAVLGDDNLLDKILIRITFPNYLVRAAASCKRWLRLISAHAFLRRYRRLHPPHVLGFYIQSLSLSPPLFVPLPHPPELASIVCRGRFYPETVGCKRFLMNFCCNGYFIITPLVPSISTRNVYSPMLPASYSTLLPPIPDTWEHDGFEYWEDDIVLGGGTDGLSYYRLVIGHKEHQSIIDVYVLQDCHWVIYTSVLSDIPNIQLEGQSLLADSKIYNLVTVNYNYHDSKLFLLDLVSLCLSVVDLPEEVEITQCQLALTDVDSEIHLTHVMGSQLRVWLHMMDNDGISNWSLVNSVCLREIWVNQMIPTWEFSEPFELCAVGANSDFIFVEMLADAFYLFDIKRKEVKKVYGLAPPNMFSFTITPFVMIWPPKFPVMKEGCDQKD